MGSSDLLQSYRMYTFLQPLSAVYFHCILAGKISATCDPQLQPLSAVYFFCNTWPHKFPVDIYWLQPLSAVYFIATTDFLFPERKLQPLSAVYFLCNCHRIVQKFHCFYVTTVVGCTRSLQQIIKATKALELLALQPLSDVHVHCNLETKLQAIVAKSYNRCRMYTFIATSVKGCQNVAEKGYNRCRMYTFIATFFPRMMDDGFQVTTVVGCTRSLQQKREKSIIQSWMSYNRYRLYTFFLQLASQSEAQVRRLLQPVSDVYLHCNLTEEFLWNRNCGYNRCRMYTFIATTGIGLAFQKDDGYNRCRMYTFIATMYRFGFHSVSTVTTVVGCTRSLQPWEKLDYLRNCYSYNRCRMYTFIATPPTSGCIIHQNSNFKIQRSYLK